MLVYADFNVMRLLLSHQLWQVEGNDIAVKKALVSISRCLQNCQSVDKIRVVGNRPLEKECQASSHRPIETIIQESLPRSIEVNPYDYRQRRDEMFLPGTLGRPNYVIPHDALHHRHIGVDPQVALRRHIEAGRQDALRMQVEADRQDFLRRHIEADRQDVLRRHIEAVPRETLDRPSDAIRGDVFRQYRERDDSHDSLHKPFEIVQRDAMGLPFESFHRDAFGRSIETIQQETLRRPSADYLAHRYSTLDTHPHSNTTSASMTNTATIKPPLSKEEVGNQDVVFKILCSTENAGGVIGTGGKVIRTLHSETGAFISVGNTLADCDERLIAVTAPEVGLF